MTSQLNQLRDKLKAFNKARDWEQFHSPKNISMALSVEAAEIVELFQWLKEEESYDLDDKQRQELEEEIGDVFLYLLTLASKFDIDLVSAAQNKLEKNERKYPVEKAKGTSKKYTDL